MLVERSVILTLSLGGVVGFAGLGFAFSDALTSTADGHATTADLGAATPASGGIGVNPDGSGGAPIATYGPMVSSGAQAVMFFGGFDEFMRMLRNGEIKAVRRLGPTENGSEGMRAISGKPVTDADRANSAAMRDAVNSAFADVEGAEKLDLETGFAMDSEGARRALMDDLAKAWEAGDDTRAEQLRRQVNSFGGEQIGSRSDLEFLRIMNTHGLGDVEQAGTRSYVRDVLARRVRSRRLLAGMDELTAAHHALERFGPERMRRLDELDGYLEFDLISRPTITNRAERTMTIKSKAIQGVSAYDDGAISSEMDRFLDFLETTRPEID